MEDVPEVLKSLKQATCKKPGSWLELINSVEAVKADDMEDIRL